MGRVNLSDVLAMWHDRLIWGARSALHFCLRHLGVAGLCSVLLMTIAVPIGGALHQQRLVLGQLHRAFVAQKERDSAYAARIASGADAGTLDGRGRLRAFGKILLPHEDIPVLVQDILQLAERQGLSVQRGEYRPQVDAAGNFLRYGMSLPVKGDASAINRFILTALRTHQALILESVRFKRELIDSKEIEARVQWVALARLPPDAAMVKLP